MPTIKRTTVAYAVAAATLLSSCIVGIGAGYAVARYGDGLDAAGVEFGEELHDEVRCLIDGNLPPASQYGGRFKDHSRRNEELCTRIGQGGSDPFVFRSFEKIFDDSRGIEEHQVSPHISSRNAS